MWIYSEKVGGWRGFKYEAYNSDPIQMEAGEIMRIDTEVAFGKEDLNAPDFSIVVWAEQQPVTMTTLGTNKGTIDAGFPAFELDPSIQIYDLKGQPIGTNETSEDKAEQDDASETIRV